MRTALAEQGFGVAHRDRRRSHHEGQTGHGHAGPPGAIVLARHARNRRLGDAVHQWVFCAMRGSPGAKTYYKTMRARGIGHQAAIRQLSNRLVGILHGCLKTGTPYDENTAWAHHITAAA